MSGEFEDNNLLQQLTLMQQGLQQDLELLENPAGGQGSSGPRCRTCGLIGHEKESSPHCLAHFAYKLSRDRRLLEQVPNECKNDCKKLLDNYDALTTGKANDMKWSFAKEGKVNLDQLRKASARAFK